MLWRVLQLVHATGSAMRPRSISTSFSALHTAHRKKAAGRIGGGGVGQTGWEVGVVWDVPPSLLTHSHLGHQRGESDHHAADGDELVNVLWVEEAHVLGLFSVVRPDLNLVLQLCVGVE